jgi:hypothetical protein
MFDRDTWFLSSWQVIIDDQAPELPSAIFSSNEMTRLVLVSNDVVLTVYLQYSISAGKRCLVSGTTSTSRQ